MGLPTLWSISYTNILQVYLALDSVFVHFYVFLQFESCKPTIYIN